MYTNKYELKLRLDHYYINNIFSINLTFIHSIYFSNFCLKSDYLNVTLEMENTHYEAGRLATANVPVRFSNWHHFFGFQ
ncbi:MAG: hypothetical protein KKF57_14910 [Firmicutes bacterium]|nr:hypothetical protein [Bacillota bacterium]